MRPASATIGLLAPTRLAPRLSRRAGRPQRRWKSRYPFFARSRSSSCIAYTPSKQLAFAFDIDGVLKQGEHVLPQAKRVMSLLTGRSGELSRPVPFLMITNGGGVTEAERCKALSAELDVEIGPDQLVQSHTPLKDYVGDLADKPVLILGGVGDAGRRIAMSYGLNQAYILQDLIAWNPSIWDRYTLSSEEEAFVKRDADFSKIPFQAIFVIHDRGLDWGASVQVITELLDSQDGILGTKRVRQFGVSDGKEIPVILTNPDVIWKTDYPLSRYGMGAFRMSLETVYKTMTGCDLPFTQFGKPHKTTYDFAETMLRRHLKQLGGHADGELDVYMVGDNPESDIAGANGHGWNSILLRTGVYQDAEGPPAHTPTTIADDVEIGVRWALGRSQGSK